MAVVSVIVLVGVVAFTFPAAIWDVRTNRLPNWITAPAAIVGIAFHTIVGAWQGSSLLGGAWDGLQYSLLGFAAGFFPLLLVWLIGGAGAGDVKLLGAVGTWLGPRLTLYTYVLSVIVAMLASLVTLLVHKFRTRADRPRKSDWRKVPYGVPVALASWLVLIWNLLRP